MLLVRWCGLAGVTGLRCVCLCSAGEERSGEVAADIARVHKRGREDCAQPKSGKALAAHWLGSNTKWPQDGLAFTKLNCGLCRANKQLVSELHVSSSLAVEQLGTPNDPLVHLCCSTFTCHAGV